MVEQWSLSYLTVSEVTGHVQQIFSITGKKQSHTHSHTNEACFQVKMENFYCALLVHSHSDAWSHKEHNFLKMFTLLLVNGGRHNSSETLYVTAV